MNTAPGIDVFVWGCNCNISVFSLLAALVLPIRDIPMPLVSSGVEHGNLRELALARMKDMGTEVRLKGLSNWYKRHGVSLFWVRKLIYFSSWDAIQTSIVEQTNADCKNNLHISLWKGIKWQIKKFAKYSLELLEHRSGVPPTFIDFYVVK